MLRLRRDEQGATAVIVTLTLIALLGMIILTVDVGQLLYKRRAMVNASDAAALAAAQSCAGLKDTDVPGTMANIFATDNVSVATGGITDVVGCDGPPFGHVTVQYQMKQGLFFAGVLGFDGPAAVRTEATAGWGPTGAANPLPIVVYTGTVQSQGACRIEENLPPGQPCYLWYDNNPEVFGGSAFGFLNLCAAGDPACSKVGWDVPGGANCPNVGTSDLRPWIDGTWQGGPNEVHYPGATFVCRLSGLSSNLWSKNLKDRIGDDLTFPVNDCATQVDKNGATVGCGVTPDKYNIIGFIVLRLDQVLDDKRDWQGSGGNCQVGGFNMTPASLDIDLDTIAPSSCQPYDTIANVKLNAPGNPKCCTENQHYTYDAVNHVVHWTDGVRNNVTISWDYAKGGPCGVPPNNSSAVCLKVTTVKVRFGGVGICEACPDFGLRSVRLCDLAIGSCPEDN
jgi:putative Flp pilus-assembly TadE/G-like protein